MYRRNRQSTIRSRAGQGRVVLRSLRWRMARVGDEVFSVCRPPQVLYAEGGNDMETNQDRHCSTPRRMADAQGVHQLSTPRQSGHHRHTVFLQPQHPGDHRRVSRVQSVTFDDCVTVYVADDYDRKSPWLRIARDRVRFRRRIKQIKLILAPVLTEQHRTLVRLRMLTFDLLNDI